MASESERPRVLAGIDEAGLGPLLGPLTLGFSVWRTKDRSSNLWRELDSVVSQKPLDDPRKFVVADSKLVFNRTPRGEQRLEATALGFLALLAPQRAWPRSAETLIASTPAALASERALFEAHPWFQRLPSDLPRFHDSGLLELRVERLWRALRKAQIELIDGGVRVVPELELNRSFAKTGNKSATCWMQCAALLRYIWDRHASERVRCVVDRQGGRAHYGGLLARIFREATVELLREADGVSEYRLASRDGSRRMRVLFAEKAERRSFAVALASCFAKYARETAMAGFNDYFHAHQPTLEPTAGYTTDGRRWLKDADELLERLSIDREALVRSR